MERFFNRIKKLRGVATRYDKLAENYLAGVQLASTRIWLRANESMTYDVRREAEAIGNLVEEDVNLGMNALRETGGVQKGYLRDLMGLPAHHRLPMTEGRLGWTCFTWKACDTAFRDNERLSSTYLAQPGATGAPRLTFLEMDEPQHLAYRRTVQPMFIKPRAFSWWRQR